MPEASGPLNIVRGAGGPARLGQVARLIPAIALALVCFIAVVRNGVSGRDLVVFVCFWVIAILVPGTLLSRRLLRPQENLPFDLALGGLTGLAWQLVSWLALRAIGLDVLATWTWCPVIVAFVAVPSLRTCWLVRFESPVRTGWAWSMALASAFVIVNLDLRWFQANPLPPNAGVINNDLWWHLSIVQELMRPGPAMTPQVLNTALEYHLNAHAHMSMASAWTGIDPEIVLFRLWYIPILLIGIGLIARFTSELSRSQAAGPLAVWLSVGALSGGYLWESYNPVSSTPIRIASPSQIVAVPFMLGAGWALARLFRGERNRGLALWLFIIAIASEGTKPTVVPLLLAGSALALLAGWFVHRRIARPALIATVGFASLQAWQLLNSETGRAARVTVLGSLRSIAPYRDATGDTGLKAINDGLILDSLSGPASVVAGATALVWFFASQLINYSGLALLARREARQDLALWWTAGVVTSGTAVFWLLDDSATSQVYFLHMGVFFGVILTAVLLARLLSQHEQRPKAVAVALGLAGGIAVSDLTADFVPYARRQVTLGALDEVLVVLGFTLLLVGIGTLVYRRYLSSTVLKGLGPAILLCGVIGVTIPGSLEGVAYDAPRWVRTANPKIDTEHRSYQPSEELEAALWLRENSSSHDVVSTNSFCNPINSDLNGCNAVGFWIGALSGRQVLLEGWGYTAEGQAQHGIDGVHRNRQPSPWPELVERSRSAVESPSPQLLVDLSENFGVDWIFAVYRAGPIAPELYDLADVRFDNGHVAIFELRS